MQIPSSLSKLSLEVRQASPLQPGQVTEQSLTSPDDFQASSPGLSFNPPSLSSRSLAAKASETVKASAQSPLNRLPEEILNKYGHLLQQVAAEHPEVKEPAELARLAADLVPVGDLDREDKVFELYRTAVASSTAKNPLAKLALKVTTAGAGFDQPYLHSGKSELALYRSSLEAGQNPASFMAEVLQNAAPEDQDFLKRSLLKELFPQKHAQLMSLLSFVPKDKIKEGRGLLATSFIEEQSVEKTAQSPEAQGIASTLLQSAASTLALTNPRSRLLVDIARERQSDGSARFSELTQGVLCQAALHPEMDNLSIYQSATKNHEKKDLIETLELADQLLPQAAKRVKELTFFSSPEQALEHRKLLLDAALAHPEVQESRELINLALAGLMDFGRDQDLAVSLYESFARSVASSHPRARRALDRLYDERGNPAFSSPSEAKKIYQAAFNPELSEAAFSQALVADAEPAPVEPPPALNPGVFSESPFIGVLTRCAEPDVAERYRELMRQALAQSPQANDPISLLQAIENLLPEGRHKEELVRGIYETVARSLSLDNPKVKFVSKQIESRKLTPKSEPMPLAQIKTDLETSLCPELSTEKFVEQLLATAPEQEQANLCEDLLLEFYPQRAKSVLKLLEFSNAQDKAKHRQLLAEAALAGQDSEPGEAIATRAAATLAKDWRREAKEDSRQLLRLGAKIRAQSDPRANFLVELAESKKSDGSLEIQEPETATLLYQLALEDDLSNEALLEKLFQTGHSQEELRFVRCEVGSALFPEAGEKASRITRYISAEDAPRVWEELFSISLQQPGELGAKELLERKVSLFGDDKTHLHEALVKLAGSDNARGQLVLEWMADFGDELRSDSVEALYKRALAPDLSEEEFVASVVEEAGLYDRDRLRFLLAQEYFPEELDFVTKLTEQGAKGDELDKQRALLLKTALEYPGGRDVARLALRATEGLRGRFGERESALAVQKLALTKLAATNPQAKFALELLSTKPESRRSDSLLAVSQTALCGLSDLEFLMQVDTQADDSDRLQLVIDIGRWLLSDPKLQVPPGWIERLESGEFSASQVKELVETLRSASTPNKSGKTDISSEENKIVIGDQELDVDL